jgi:hypothetical protein
VRKVTQLPSGTLEPDANRILLERFNSSAARHDLMLAAWTHAWCQVRGEASALVRLEHHGREGTGVEGAGTAVGWFVHYFPLRVTAAPTLRRQLAAVRLARRALPDKGVGYGLLRYLSSDPAVRASMQALARPRVGLSFRGVIDDGFRGERPLPWIGSDSNNLAWEGARAWWRDACDAELSCVLRGGVLEWRIVFDEAALSVREGAALMAAIQHFLLTALAPA